MWPKTQPIDKPAPAPIPAPPAIEDCFNEASGDTAYATSIFTNAIDVLVEANAAFDDVEMRATSEIDRLVHFRDEAALQRRKNQATISNLQALSGAGTPAE